MEFYHEEETPGGLPASFQRDGGPAARGLVHP